MLQRRLPSAPGSPVRIHRVFSDPADAQALRFNQARNLEHEARATDSAGFSSTRYCGSLSMKNLFASFRNRMRQIDKLRWKLQPKTLKYPPQLKLKLFACPVGTGRCVAVFMLGTTARVAATRSALSPQSAPNGHGSGAAERASRDL